MFETWDKEINGLVEVDFIFMEKALTSLMALQELLTLHERLYYAHYDVICGIRIKWKS